MYRFVLFLVFLTYCLSAPLNNFRSQQYSNLPDRDEVVDNNGSGYSFFRKQQVEGGTKFKSSDLIPAEDLSAYSQASAFKSKPTAPSQTRKAGNYQRQSTNYNQQTVARTSVPQPRNDFSQYRSAAPSGFGGQTQQDFQTLNSQNTRLPQRNTHSQQPIFSNFANTQTQSWSNQQPMGHSQFQTSQFQQMPSQNAFRNW